MTVKEIYYREGVEKYVFVEDDEGQLYRWYLGGPRIVPVPHEPMPGLLTYDPPLREGMAMGLRSLGHTVLGPSPALTIKGIRRRAGLSQRALSDKFGIPRRTIEDWEAGRRTPPDYVVRLLAAACENG